MIDGLTLEHKNPDNLATTFLSIGETSGGAYDFQGAGVSVIGNATIGVLTLGGGVNEARFDHGGTGSVTVDGNLILGSLGTGQGAYNLTGGGVVNVGLETIVGDAGTGVFNNTSGTHTTAGNLVIGKGNQGSGTYRLSSNGTVTVGSAATPADTIVGDLGTGLFDNSGGTHTVSGNLILGASGTYLLSGGGTVSSANIIVGAEGTGIFSNLGGTHQTGTLLLGSQLGAHGSYTIGTGSTLNVTGDLGIGVVARVPNPDGTLPPTIPQAAGSGGSFTQTGGQVTVSGGFWQDSNNSSQSVYRLEGGTLTLGYDTPTNRTASMSGNSLFEHKGGTLDAYLAAGDFTIGTQYSEGYNTTYRMTGASTQANFFGLVVGNLGSGILDQQNGTVNASSLVIGLGPRAFAPKPDRTRGIYEMSDGKLNVEGNMFVGWGYSPIGGTPPAGPGGAGTFKQTGGDVKVGIAGVPPTDLHLGSAGTVGGGTGIYDMSGGTLTVTGAIWVGDTSNTAPGTGQFLQKGGSVQAGSITVSNGSYNYSGGEIRLGDTNAPGTMTINSGGEFRISGGTPLTVFGDVINNDGGLIKVTGPLTTITWAGKVQNDDAYVSDPATNIFNSDLVVGSNGYLVGGLGDIFQINGNFLNSSTNAAQWDTDLATLIFGGAGIHTFGVAYDGTESAFAWGDIRAGAGVQLSFLDTSSIAGMVLFAGILDLEDGLAAILLDDGETLTIYYDRTKLENAYLNNATELPDGLTLVAYGPTPNVPEPGTLALLGVSLAALAASRRRRK